MVQCVTRWSGQNIAWNTVRMVSVSSSVRAGPQVPRALPKRATGQPMHAPTASRAIMVRTTGV
ncbi:MAG: hypothetical protein EBU31_09830 [Proteobacteria bacterium]|nr:hypothetical protein [Pseudomonadota bacterium]